MARLQIDRRAIVFVINFDLIIPYMFFLVGFDDIFLNEILLANVVKAGVDISVVNIMHAMAIPAFGMLRRLLLVVSISYRRPHHYDLKKSN